MYFSCLEALQNVAKYALVFTVADDGRGFDPASAARGSGLQGMADRIEAIGGTLEVDSAPGQGTTVTGRAPVTSREER